MTDHFAARATRLIEAWLAADPDGKATAIVDAAADQEAAEALHDL
jgi:hypothetical protein